VLRRLQPRIAWRRLTSRCHRFLTSPMSETCIGHLGEVEPACVVMTTRISRRVMVPGVNRAVLKSPNIEFPCHPVV
jgi:hypothetical protein